MKYEVPICWACKKDVEETEIYSDFYYCMYCHSTLPKRQPEKLRKLEENQVDWLVGIVD